MTTTMTYPASLPLPKRFSLAKFNADAARERTDSASAEWWDREHERLVRDATRTDELVPPPTKPNHTELIERAVLARQIAHLKHPPPPGVASAAELRKELTDDLARGRIAALKTRATSVLEMHERYDGVVPPPHPFAPAAGSYSHTGDGRMVKWPDAHPSEFDARKKLKSAGIDHSKMDTAGVHGAITALLANDDDDDDRTDGADAPANPWLGRGLAEYTTGRAPLELAPTKPRAKSRRRR